MADDLDRWLAAARPHTAADDGWAGSPAGDRALSGIRRAVSHRLARLPRRHAWGSAQRLVLVAAVAILLAAISTPVGSEPGRPAVVPSAPHPANMALVAYHSCADMLAGLRSHTAANVGPWGLLGAVQYADALAANGQFRAADPVPVSLDQSVAAHSTTNVQEAGVDEPDIVKSDGNRIVSVSGGRLHVIDTATKKITGYLRLPGAPAWAPTDLLVAGDRALVLLHPTVNVAYSGGPGAAIRRVGPDGNATSTYLLVELSGRPRVLDSISPHGQYVDARMVGSTVRLVVRSGPSIAFPTDDRGKLTDAQRTARNKAIVRRAPLSAWLPTYDVTVGGFARSVPCGLVSHPSDYTGTSMLTIYTIDLAKGLADTAPVSLAADGDTVYGTHSSLYIASNPAWWSSCCLAVDAPAIRTSLTGNRRAAKTPIHRAEKTEIHRFDITGPRAPRYLGSGSVPGRLLSQYSLSDYEGHLRVATTTGQNTVTASSSVYVLSADTLAVTGHVGGLGKGEQIYAVRFVGPLGYVVTFRQLDPLYVLDLHDPSAPHEVAELKLTGYSSYLHPAGDGRLIGVGQEASAQGMVAGLQVSLFDVSDPSSPHRLARVYRADAPGEGQLDPHAFLYWPASGLVIVPIQSWTGSVSGKVLVLKVSDTALATVGLISHPAAPASQQYDYLGIQRSLVVGDSIWTLSGAGVKVSDMTTLADQAWIPFG